MTLSDEQLLAIATAVEDMAISTQSIATVLMTFHQQLEDLGASPELADELVVKLADAFGIPTPPKPGKK